MKVIILYIVVCLFLLIWWKPDNSVDKKVLSKPKIESFDWKVMQNGIQLKVVLKAPIELDSLYTDYGLILLDDYGGNYLSDTMYAKGQSELTFFFPRDYFSMPNNVYDSLIRNKYLHRVRFFEVSSIPLRGKLVRKSRSNSSCDENFYLSHRIIHDQNRSYIFRNHFDPKCRDCSLVYYKDSLSKFEIQ